MKRWFGSSEEPAPSLIDIARNRNPTKDLAQLREYEVEFARFRNEPITFFEIGVKHGLSLLTWLDYFPNARVVGLDIKPRDITTPHRDRLTVVLGDQSDPAILDEIAAEHGPFHIVLDDGSHIPEHQILGFEKLLPHIVDDGLYVCEDLHTSYRHDGPSAIDYFQALVGPVMDREQGASLPIDRELWRNVARVSFFLRTAIVAKRIGGPKGQTEERETVRR